MIATAIAAGRPQALAVFEAPKVGRSIFAACRSVAHAGGRALSRRDCAGLTEDLQNSQRPAF